MAIHRVPEVPFAQIANEALRDHRLSFRATGVLALVLSHTGEWDAGLDWLVDQKREGREALQSALNELTALGYRKVSKVQDERGHWTTIVDWSHTADAQVSDTPENRGPVQPEAGPTDARQSRVSSRTPLPEHHSQNTKEQNTILFDEFWHAFGLRKGKTEARKAWEKAIKDTDPQVIISAAREYVLWLDTQDDPPQQKYAQGWLNGRRWEDELLPRRATGKKSQARLLIDLFAEEDQKGIEG